MLPIVYCVIHAHGGEQGPTSQSTHYAPNMGELGLPTEIVQLYDAFPFGLREKPYSKAILLPYVPPRQKAIDAVECYVQRFGWV